MNFLLTQMTLPNNLITFFVLLHLPSNLILSQILNLFDQHLTEPCKESLSFCTKNEIVEIISSLDYYKAVGINSISIKILKLAKEQIAEHLCFIYNLSFITDIFPDSLKIAKVTPVYKKGSKLKCANYRPITLLSTLDKII